MHNHDKTQQSADLYEYFFWHWCHTYISHSNKTTRFHFERNTDLTNFKWKYFLVIVTWPKKIWSIHKGAFLLVAIAGATFSSLSGHCDSVWDQYWDTRLLFHYIDVMMSAMASQITSVSFCLLNGLFRLRSKKASKLRFTGLCEGNPPVTGGFPSQRAVTRKMFPFDDVSMPRRIHPRDIPCEYMGRQQITIWL